MTAALLSMKNVHAGYGGMEILHGVSLNLAQGDLMVVVGPNGSGKSTTIKSVFGLTTITCGSIRFAGEEIAGRLPHEVARRGVGYVPQGRLVFETLSVAENLAMGGYDLSRCALRERIAAVLALFPALAPKLSRQASFLSGGEQQQLSIARALVRLPRLLLLDEPSLGLDPKTQQLIFSTLQRINRGGVSMLMVEQNAKHALAICTKAIVVEGGRVVASGGPGLARDPRMRELYLGGA